ncbi:MAG: chemotaxis protein CheD [Lachnospiraceae bacterium]|nr:chemotaxis protein CheD [Lachnospiraceae bacterium]
MGNVIKVGIADMNVCKSPDKITTIGLGSCIGAVLYDSNTKTAGLVHVMLPDSTKIKNNQNKMKFADTGIDLLIEQLEKMGINKRNLKAKIAGGAKMFSFNSGSSDIGNIGNKNIEAVRARLESHRIKIVSEDVGLDYGRTIIFDPDSCELSVIKAGKQVNII